MYFNAVALDLGQKKNRVPSKMPCLTKCLKSEAELRNKSQESQVRSSEKEKKVSAAVHAAFAAPEKRKYCLIWVRVIGRAARRR